MSTVIQIRNVSPFFLQFIVSYDPANVSRMQVSILENLGLYKSGVITVCEMTKYNIYMTQS
jgi:hypothetical protein